ncbi:MAG: hypothetical protein ACP5L1_07800 [Caldivirga sp.]
MPKLEVRGFVGYIRYVAYLGSYEEYMRSIKRRVSDNNCSIKNNEDT